jgi:pSer/pThr/pTyr-binding forkhead associated (FHA) protein
MNSETTRFSKLEFKRPYLLFDANGNERWGLEGKRITIGRHVDNIVCLANDDYVSGHHAHIFLDKGEYWIRDLGSSNGTLINNLSVTNPVKIGPGDIIVIGRTRLEVE